MSSYPDTQQRIREAAFRALAEHGYADLSIKDIGNELGQNPSIIYHYYDSKDDLLLSMLDVFVEIFVGQQDEQQITDAEDELRRFVGQILHPTPAQVERAIFSPPTDIETAVSRVYVELWAHATWDDDFRKETTQAEDSLRAVIARILRAGIEDGQFRSVDAELTADHICFLIEQGLHTQATTNRDDAVERVLTIIDGIVADISLED
ncbi:transcriptional regulator, TetR family protein [Haladaptatus paucihalophilus DX253]|uniref:Transcriptional regulator, TetR family n=1 Tax=Haladaptatus paucihalophilus DX253 TaxID=797209 RepID=E7QZG6_HALPU|nr:TetR/AcrR family transcriptional regulator [Haladaptatus paucihalophilus]EFW90087.1 transcriptional regulator, TetR family protein [Haladaptatus paucihalophilus DX253]SHL04944.1 transcriptional regulator, TetR family [Haladaptatus paucihalophilus DX253]